MKLRGFGGALAIAFIACAAVWATQDTPPVDKGFVEQLDVNLVIVDVQVLDRKGSPVPGLVKDDFDVSVGGKPISLASFDASCGEVAERPDIVLAFDYEHLDEIERGMALDSARRALGRIPVGDAKVMVVALTGGLRIEQPFTNERARIPAVLSRMRNDATLFAGNFKHLSEAGFVRGLSALFDVVATVPRPKAILFYSAMQDVPLDEQFRNLAAMASVSRSVIYPVDVRGLAADAPRPVRLSSVGGRHGRGG